MNEKELLARISEARKDRARIASRLNDFYSLAAPHRPRVGGSAKKTQPSVSAQDDIFDQTMQEAVVDFAANQQDFFTPDYKPWLKIKPGVALDGAADEGNFQDAVKRYEDRLYDLIRTTDFYEQQQEVFVDLAGGAGGMVIPAAPATRPVRCTPVLMHGLLFDEGPHNDLDGRWHEFFAAKRDLKEFFPDVQFGENISRKADKDEVRIVQGVYREWTDKGPRWRWAIEADGKIVHDKLLPPTAPPSVLIARWRHAPPSAWGPGPADVAMPAARTLDVIAYLNLKKLGKETDTPYTYENDGIFNPEGGIEPGTFLARRPGTKPPEPLFTATTSQNLFFDREFLRQIVKRSLYVDGPFQRGDTPPTATQWLDEKAMNQRRFIARRRLYREYVLPCLQRFAYIFSIRGELPPVEIGGREVAVEFVSPLSKASDAEEASSAIQLMQSIVGVLGETGLATIDPFETATELQEKLGDTIVKLIRPDAQQDFIQKILSEGRNLVANKAP